MSESQTEMRYSGRTVKANKIEPGTLLYKIMKLLHKPSFQEVLFETVPQLRGVIPEFNSVFVNHYRRPEEWGSKPDGLGFHSDDERDLQSSVILAITFCEVGGERIFTLQDKKTNEVLWRKEPKNGSALWMLPGCQDRTKHEVSDRKTHINGTKVTGGRISLTFRQLRKP